MRREKEAEMGDNGSYMKGTERAKLWTLYGSKDE